MQQAIGEDRIVFRNEEAHGEMEIEGNATSVAKR
jgi:hypothetical protein